ncbi:MAG: thioesterase family protein [Pseudomonadota bacterium]
MAAPTTSRDDYPVFRPIQTRWMDNDVYGHVNNVVYYAYFDTAVNAYLIEKGVLDFTSGDTIGLVVETKCQYFAPLSFPEPIEAGLTVNRIGRSSVTYGIGLFSKGSETPAAEGHFVHVYVDRLSRRPASLPDPFRKVVEELLSDAKSG